MAIIVVVNKLKDFIAEIPDVEIITAKSYLSDEKYAEAKNAKIINLCRSYSYQSTGYYISLLAAARGHKVIPDITTIQDTKTLSIIRIKSEEFYELIQKSLAKISSEEYILKIFFGQAIDPEMQPLAQQLFYQFQSPIIFAFFENKKQKWKLQSLEAASTKTVNPEEYTFMISSATEYFSTGKFSIKKPQPSGYEIAILINPTEDKPPSNKSAIKKFIKAAEALDMSVWAITRDEYNHIGEYDALFIRETTNVNHHTYRFARKAAVEGLVVLDDPESILKCSNKVYMAELMERNNIPTPKTTVISKDNADDILKLYNFPVILKLPDSCFSLGVVKVETQAELDRELKRMLDKSDLIIAQEFLPTKFDWRIGIIDRKPLYACKYYMAGDHWQIIDYDGNGSYKEGKDEAVPLYEVPHFVLQTALKAANLIGNGFYGVDVKEIDGKPYLVEVNDNPSIDAGVEDKELKDELYRDIMKVFLDRIRKMKEAGRN